MYLNKHGTGLSLYIAQLIAQQLEGRCSFKSKEGKYTRFLFQINAESADQIDNNHVELNLGVIAEEEEDKDSS